MGKGSIQKAKYRWWKRVARKSRQNWEWKKLPENDSDDKDTPAEGRQRMVKQGEGENILEQTPGAMREGGDGDGDSGSDGDGDDEQEEDDEDVSESKIQALQAKHEVAELHR